MRERSLTTPGFSSWQLLRDEVSMGLSIDNSLSTIVYWCSTLLHCSLHFSDLPEEKSEPCLPTHWPRCRGSEHPKNGFYRILEIVSLNFTTGCYTGDTFRYRSVNTTGFRYWVVTGPTSLVTPVLACPLTDVVCCGITQDRQQNGQVMSHNNREVLL